MLKEQYPESPLTGDVLGQRAKTTVYSPLPQDRSPVSRVLHSPARRPIFWVCGIVGVAVIWQVVASVLVRDALLFPSFSDTIADGWVLFVTQHSVYGDIGVTAEQAGIGYALSMTAVPLGLVVGHTDWARMMVEPLNGAMYAIPGIALIPVAIIWFGLGNASKVAIVFVAVFFYLFMNTINGVATVAKEYRELAQSYRSSRWHTFLTITIPGSLPFIFTGLQLSIGRALIGVVAAELIVANSGLGYLLSHYGDNFATGDLFAIIGFIGFSGAALTALVGVWGHHFDRWRDT